MQSITETQQRGVPLWVGANGVLPRSSYQPGRCSPVGRG